MRPRSAASTVLRRPPGLESCCTSRSPIAIPFRRQHCEQVRRCEMAEAEFRPAKTPCEIPLRRRGFLNARVARLLVTSACAAAVVGMAAPAQAEPTDPFVYVTGATDDTFLRALDHLGIGRPSDPEAINTARAACAYIQDGHS